MANDARDTLIDWLKDAYGMEQKAIEMLEKQDERLESYPVMRDKIQEHLETTKAQAERVELCLEQLGSSTSAIKSGIGKLMGNMAALGNTGAADEVIKGGIADYAFENFEIACYTALVHAAQTLDEPEVARVCQQNLEEEKEMAAWLERHLPETTMEFLERQAAGAPAKR
jgi:ferritin-like metal-binding protein YciE